MPFALARWVSGDPDVIARIQADPREMGYMLQLLSAHYGPDVVVQVQQGSLYPALHRLENRGLLGSDWKLTDTAYHCLTLAEGRRAASAEAAVAQQIADAKNPPIVSPALPWQAALSQRGSFSQGFGLCETLLMPHIRGG